MKKFNYKKIHYSLGFIIIAAFCLLVFNAKSVQASNFNYGIETDSPAGFASLNGGTNGGTLADKKHTFVVHNRQELLAALGNSSNNTPKLIYIAGCIDMNADANGHKLTLADYATAGYSLDSYLKQYDPQTWGRKKIPSGKMEEQRQASQKNQSRQITINVPSNTTIYGIQNAQILGGSLKLTAVQNVIIRNINFVTPFDLFPQWDPTDGKLGNWNSQYDSITLKKTRNVWIDHNTFSDGDATDNLTDYYFNRIYQHHDGCVDITDGSDYITFSYNKLFNHDKTMLIGSSDSKTSDTNKLHVTIDHNWFENLVQRQPRVRFGTVHLYNNYYSAAKTPLYKAQYIIGVGVNSRILAQNNDIEIPDFDKNKVVKLFKGDQLTMKNTLFNGLIYNSGNDFNNSLKDTNWHSTYNYDLDPVSDIQNSTTHYSGAGILQ